MFKIVPGTLFYNKTIKNTCIIVLQHPNKLSTTLITFYCICIDSNKLEIITFPFLVDCWSECKIV